MEEIIPVKTELGYLYGRDAIFIDKFVAKEGVLILEGEINSNLASDYEGEKRYIGYHIEFRGTLAFKSTSLDFWHRNFDSSFDEVINSDWVQTLFGGNNGGNNKRNRHFVFQTYDDVIEVVCTQFNLTLEGGNQEGKWYEIN